MNEAFPFRKDKVRVASQPKVTEGKSLVVTFDVEMPTFYEKNGERIKMKENEYLKIKALGEQAVPAKELNLGDVILLSHRFRGRKYTSQWGDKVEQVFYLQGYEIIEKAKSEVEDLGDVTSFDPPSNINPDEIPF